MSVTDFQKKKKKNWLDESAAAGEIPITYYPPNRDEMVSTRRTWSQEDWVAKNCYKVSYFPLTSNQVWTRRGGRRWRRVVWAAADEKFLHHVSVVRALCIISQCRKNAQNGPLSLIYDWKLDKLQSVFIMNGNTCLFYLGSEVAYWEAKKFLKCTYHLRCGVGVWCWMDAV